MYFTGMSFFRYEHEYVNTFTNVKNTFSKRRRLSPRVTTLRHYNTEVFFQNKSCSKNKKKNILHFISRQRVHRGP